MKIEKINDNQIRCTLDKLDLTSRQISLAELAYGSEKAKKLFSEMMYKAATELGFEADDIPIMIEAIPVSSEALIIIITKIEEPEELDTRFSKFTSPDDSDEDFYDDNMFELEDSDDYIPEETHNSPNEFKDILDLYRQYKQQALANPSKNSKETNLGMNFLLYTFKDLDTLTSMSKQLASVYKGKSTLYKHSINSGYYLLLESNNLSAADLYNKYDATLSEYGQSEKAVYASKAYLNEHAKILIKDKAINQLSKI